MPPVFLNHTMEKEFFKNKKVVVMGLGRFGGGVDSALFAAKCGADVLVTDLASEADLAGPLETLRDFSIRYCLGRHDEADFTSADVVIVNPAVPPGNKLVLAAARAGALVTSQMELFFQLCPARIIGITGANGKSTTTSLTAHILQAGANQGSYGNVFLAGNIGNKPLLDIVDQIEENDLVVLEISNFQLEQLDRIAAAPLVALITNLTPNHLDRHGTFEAYCRVKENIFIHQKTDVDNPAVSIFNAEDPITRAWYKKYLDDHGRKCLAFSPDDVPAEYANSFSLPGRTNRANLAAALAVASCFEIDPACVAQAVATFKGLPNRCCFVTETNGVRWYDDSKATTPVSTLAALNGIEEPKILIAGGYDKKISFAELGQTIAARCKACVLIGQTADAISQAVQNAAQTDCIIKKADSMEQAVQIANDLSAAGDVVLMSPACASYDMFKNYTQRAEAFINAVITLR